MPDIFVPNQEEKKIPETPPKPEGATSPPVPQKPSPPQNNVGLFSAYTKNPTNVSFVNLEENETILLFLREAFITNIPWILLVALLLVVPFFFIFFIQFIFQTTSLAIPLRLVLALSWFYYIIVLGFALIRFITWFYTVGLVTDKRVIDIDIYNASTVTVAATKLNNIKDAQYSQGGFFKSFFDFGDVLMQTEGIEQNFKFENAPHPSQVVNILTEMIGEQ